MSESLGVLGVGHLASYVVAGLRNAGDCRAVLLSPRNAEQAQLLAQQHGCNIAACNQEVVDSTRLLLLSVRPHHVENLLQKLDFTPQHLVISCVAGMPLADIQRLVGPATVVRTLPLASAEVKEGAIPLYPDHPEVFSMLDKIGCVIPFENENSFELASVAACMNGWMYAFFEQLTQWYTEQGIPSEQARTLVLHSIRGATGLAAAKPHLSLQGISDSIATEGTYTKLGLDLLKQQQSFRPWLQASERVSKALNSD